MVPFSIYRFEFHQRRRNSEQTSKQLTKAKAHFFNTPESLLFSLKFDCQLSVYDNFTENIKGFQVFIFLMKEFRNSSIVFEESQNLKIN